MDLTTIIFLIIAISIGLLFLINKYFRTHSYAIISNHNVVRCEIDLVIADTPKKRASGLMFQKSLPENSGMVFVFEKPGEICFFMKNTLIPLDMIVISPDRKVADMEINLVPMSEDPIILDVLSSFVIEVNAGFCERKGIAIGDTVSIHLHKLF